MLRTSATCSFLSAASLPRSLMTEFSLSAGQRIHLIGIGGAGMSGLARLLKARGLTVSGSDAVPTALTEKLFHDDGIHVDYVQDGSAIHPGLDGVVTTAAAKADNAELAAARRLGVPVRKYAEALGALMRERVGIAVAGTHGKTTTSSMLAHTLREADLEPSYLIGGVPHDLGSNAEAGRGSYFVAEACEYDRSFHHLAPIVAVVTNIDADHLDYFGSLEAVHEAFARFVAMVPATGLVVVHGDDEATLETVRRAAIAPVVSYGEEEWCDWRIIRHGVVDGRPSARFEGPGSAEPLALTLGVPGWQNVYNAAAVAVVADYLGAEAAAIQAALEGFRGVARRFDRLGSLRGVPILDDYAHHPAEIRATLAAARQAHPHEDLWVVFQPHQVTRTQVFFNGFSEALALADRVILLDVYAAREGDEDHGMRALSEELAEAVRLHGTEAEYLSSFDAVIAHLRSELPAHGAAVMTMGAGNVHEIAEALVTTYARAA